MKKLTVKVNDAYDILIEKHIKSPLFYIKEKSHKRLIFFLYELFFYYI